MSKPKGRTTRLAPDACLDCGKKLDAASGFTHGRRPKPGSVSICMGCGHVMMFDSDLRLRALTDAEIVEMAGNQDMINIQNALGALWKAHPESRTK